MKYTSSMKITTMMALVMLAAVNSALAQLKNFDEKGRQLLRLSAAGDAIDAHDGEIAQFEGIYYLYGTSYDCGFEWGNKRAPFCGFKVYSSPDLQTWTDRGFLFDASTSIWQSRCDGKTYGCFRPHVIFNKQFNNYVLWINVYDNVVGYRVFTSKTPTGPFAEVKEPTLAVNADMPRAGLNNGDHDTFVDDDGVAYLAYTDWRAKGAIVIERLSPDYLTGSGEFVKGVTDSMTEAPGLFKRNGKYYVTYSDPNCGYCSGTGTSYRTASSPLGPWSAGVSISNNSCGGQPSFMSTIRINAETVFLYGSDLWNNAAKNEALANYYWAPLEFGEDGSILPLRCEAVSPKTRVVPRKAGAGRSGAAGAGGSGAGKAHTVADESGMGASGAGKAHAVAGGSGAGVGVSFIAKAAVDAHTQWSQAFVAGKDGVLQSLSLSLYKNQLPGEALTISLYRADEGYAPVGKPLHTMSISPSSLGWSVKRRTFRPMIKVQKGKRYLVVLSTEASTGYYGFASTDASGAGGAARGTADGAVGASASGVAGGPASSVSGGLASSRDKGRTFLEGGDGVMKMVLRVGR